MKGKKGTKDQPVITHVELYDFARVTALYRYLSDLYLKVARECEKDGSAGENQRKMIHEILMVNTYSYPRLLQFFGTHSTSAEFEAATVMQKVQSTIESKLLKAAEEKKRKGSKKCSKKVTKKVAKPKSKKA